MISTLQTERTGTDVRIAGPRFRWSAVFAGWLIGNAVMLLMMNFGSAIGLSAIDVTNPETAARGIAGGTVIWAFITWAVAFFVGGALASYFSGDSDRTAGLLHGLGVWGLAAATVLFVGTLVGAIGTLGAATVTGGAIASERTEVPTTADIEAAAQNPEQNPAAAAIQDFQTQPGLRAQAAETAQNVSAAALWLVFFSGLTGLVFSAFGGAFASRRLVASADTRRYEHA